MNTPKKPTSNVVDLRRGVPARDREAHRRVEQALGDALDAEDARRALQRATNALDAEDKQALPARIAAVRRYVLAPRFPEPGSYPNRQAAIAGAADAADALARAVGVGPDLLIVALRDMADAYDDPEQLTRLAEESGAKGRAALAEAGALQAELARRAKVRP